MNIFLINSNIVLYCGPFIKYIWISKILLVSIGLKSTEKKSYIINYKIVLHITTVYNLLFKSLLFLTDKFCEETVASITVMTNLLFGYVKLIGYILSPVNVESSNPCVAPSPRIKILLFLLSICISSSK